MKSCRRSYRTIRLPRRTRSVTSLPGIGVSRCLLHIACSLLDGDLLPIGLHVRQSGDVLFQMFVATDITCFPTLPRRRSSMASTTAIFSISFARARDRLTACLWRLISCQRRWSFIHSFCSRLKGDTLFWFSRFIYDHACAPRGTLSRRRPSQQYGRPGLK